MSQKIGLVSFPFNIKGVFLILGEIYDDKFKTVKMLKEFQKDLHFLYHFKFNVKTGRISNIEYIIFFQNKYKLTKNIYLKKENNFEESKIIFKTPILYDLNRMEKIFEISEKYIYQCNDNPTKICAIVPSIDPIGRGILLEDVLKQNPLMIILFGGKQGANKDKTSTLMKRFLLSRNFPLDSIIKINETPTFEFILERTKDLENIYLGCLPNQIIELSKISRFLRLKSSFICPMYGKED